MTAQMTTPRDFVELERVRLLLLAAQRDGSRQLTDSLRPGPLTPSQAEILGVLAGEGPLSLADLGRRIVCESGSPSRTVDLMVQRGLVNRSPNPRDRRFVELEITDQGRALLPLIISGVSSLDSRITDQLDEQEVTDLARLLTKLIAGTDAQRRFLAISAGSASSPRDF